MESLETQLRYLSDRFAIQDVIARYARGQDDHQGDDPHILDDWDRVFTPDAIVDYSAAGPGNGPFSYRDLALRMRGDGQRPGQMNGGFRRWQHMLGLPTVRIEGDRAFAKTDLLATHVGRGDPAAPWHLFDAATFHDDLVRTAVGWRIGFRRLELHYVEVIRTTDLRGGFEAAIQSFTRSGANVGS